jgi:hypothetical protein
LGSGGKVVYSPFASMPAIGMRLIALAVAFVDALAELLTGLSKDETQHEKRISFNKN